MSVEPEPTELELAAVVLGEQAAATRALAAKQRNATPRRPRLADAMDAEAAQLDNVAAWLRAQAVLRNRPTRSTLRS